MVFPDKEARAFYVNVAFVVTNAGNVKLFAIKPIKGRYWECDLGIFFLEGGKHYSFEKGGRWFFYHVKIPVPLDVESLHRVTEYIKTNGYDRFTLDALRNLVGEEVASQIAFGKSMLQAGSENPDEGVTEAHKDALAASALMLERIQETKAEEKISEQLGGDSYAFLRSLSEIDLPAIDYAAKQAFQSEKPPRMSKEISGWIPRMETAHLGLFVIDNKKIVKRQLKVVKDPKDARVYGYVRTGGRVDITDKQCKLNHGKTALYIVPINTEPKVTIANGHGEPKKRGRKPMLVATPQVPTAMALNLHCYDLLREFIRYDSLAIQNEIDKIQHTQMHLNREYKPIKKTPMNPLIILMLIIGFVAIYQGIINPALSEQQTQQEIANTRNRNNQPPVPQQQTNGTTTTPPPPANNDNGGIPWKLPFVN